jgi:hypothetical protein
MESVFNDVLYRRSDLAVVATAIREAIAWQG